ncbi:adherens junction-associated protein 1 isoform X2 [Denticeps clupeoides]|uniref:adherens junction-associated protein 1 isoform X2 n=1 Tax=Denticeps clupeoides TaxID=299321 RepID=UPI0010A3567D|nr:adherens junction-associated protein 1 isoform X2 [Denticeps clupeoides]
MWIKRSMSVLRRGDSLVRRTWILLILLHLALDLSLCTPVVSRGLGFKLLPKTVPRLRPRSLPLLDSTSVGPHWRTLGSTRRPTPHPFLSPSASKRVPDPKIRTDRLRRLLKESRHCKGCPPSSSVSTVNSVALLGGTKSDIFRVFSRSRRQLLLDGYDNSQDGRTTTVAGFIDWGPTGVDAEVEEEDRIVPNTTLSTKALSTTTTTVPTSTTTQSPKRTYAVVTTMQPRKLSTTPPIITFTQTVKPPKVGDTPGLAVHQIITITVSLIMVIAALITTLVLKNCCAQSGNGRHSSHQRKINQQEESCQNLTDFTPARVPSKVDIFTAYNDSLQCSHECVRAAVPVYTDEMIQHTPIYKTSYNGNRPSPTERQLIPVAFVSEKWFEISC